MAPPQYACEQCGSTDFYEDDGKWYCHNGHEQEGGQQVGEDDGDYGRAGKVRRQKVPKENQKALKVYRGPRGLRLYLKAWQHILWRQSHAFIHQHGLPTELWALVRELWTLRLSKLEGRFQEDGEREPVLSSSPTSDESGGEINANGIMSQDFQISKRIDDNPTLSDTIALNYIGILILRHPTSLASIYQHIRQEEICYIRAIRYVPSVIRDHLAPEYHLALDTTTIPTELDLQLWVYWSATMYGTTFDMEIPALNWRLMLLEHVRSLALPLEVFTMVKFLASLLQYTFTYPPKHRERRNATTFPEAQLMALIIVATKLVFPFDSDTSYIFPRTINEPATTKMNWHAWLDAKKKQSKMNGKTEQLSPMQAIEVNDADVLNMSTSQLDSYMDWFQRTYVKDVKADNLHQQILDMFPILDTRQGETGVEAGDSKYDKKVTTERLRGTLAKSKLQRIVSDEESSASSSTVFRPGQRYQRYRSLEEMSEAAIHLHKEAAALACLDTNTLLRACLRTERLLLLYQHEQRRGDLFGDEDQIELK